MKIMTLEEAYKKCERPGDGHPSEEWYAHKAAVVTHAYNALPKLVSLLTKCQEALDVLAEDADEAGYQERGRSAAKLASEVRSAIHNAGNIEVKS